MWTRKAPAEIEEEALQMRAEVERIRFNPLPALLAALLLATAFSFSRHSGWSGKFTFAIPTAGALRTIGWPWWFIFWFLTLYVISAIPGRSIGAASNAALICPVCHAVRGGREPAKCACDAAPEPLRNWRWIEEPSDEAVRKT
jgi:hypothetical protein